MRTKTFAVGILLLLAVLVTTAEAAEIPYTFTTTDLVIERRDTNRVTLGGINDQGAIVANIFAPTGQPVIFTPRGRNHYRPTTFSCPNSTSNVVTGINNQDITTGQCSQENKIRSFLRSADGTFQFLDFPGAAHTQAFGINNRNQIVGIYWNPLASVQSGPARIHGFVWSSGQFQTLDFPLPNTYTLLLGINSNGQVIGEYTTYDPLTNLTLAHKPFLYDNGNWILDFPESLEYIGGPSFFLASINDLGQVLAYRDHGTNRFLIYEAGNFTELPMPAGWVIQDVRGLNARGEFVGTYFPIETGESHGFIARPTLTIKEKQKD